MSLVALRQTELDFVVVPDWVHALHGTDVQPVWRNEAGGITYRIGSGTAYLKVERPSADWSPEAEASRLAWLEGRLPVSRPLARGTRGDLAWLLTSGLPGDSAVAPRWRARPETAVPALGRALRAFHDALPADDCPFSWSVADRVQRFDLDPRFVAESPPLDPVVCHGDACNPNFLLDGRGHLAGYVDLGALGVADRWADLAPALLSLGWNYGGDHEESFLTAYGIERDGPKLAFYTALWDGVGESLGLG